MTCNNQQRQAKKRISSQDNFLLEGNEIEQARRTKWEKGGEQIHKATSFPLLFTEGYDCQAQAIFPSLFQFFFLSTLLPLLVLSISAHDLAGAAEARLNCAISYMFTLLASFWAYFPLNISPHIILHFLYNDMLSLISLCKPFLGWRIRIQ